MEPPIGLRGVGCSAAAARSVFAAAGVDIGTPPTGAPRAGAPRAGAQDGVDGPFFRVDSGFQTGSGFDELNGCSARLGVARALHPFVAASQPRVDLMVVSAGGDIGAAGADCDINPPERAAVLHVAFEFAHAAGARSLRIAGGEPLAVDAAARRLFAVSRSSVGRAAAEIAMGAADFDLVLAAPAEAEILLDLARSISGAAAASPTLMFSTDGLSAFGAGRAPGVAGLINAGALALLYAGDSGRAAQIANALLKTIEDGLHTEDLRSTRPYSKMLDAEEFARAVIDRFDARPRGLTPARFKGAAGLSATTEDGRSPGDAPAPLRLAYSRE